MKGLKESVLIIGQVLGLLMGDNFATTLEVLEQYPYIRFYG